MSMRVTLDHPEAKAGRPVCLDEKGRVIPAALALQRFIDIQSLSTREQCLLFGCRRKEIQRWRFGIYQVPVRVLNIMANVLESERKALTSRKLPPIPRQTVARIKQFLSNMP